MQGRVHWVGATRFLFNPSRVPTRNVEGELNHAILVGRTMVLGELLASKSEWSPSPIRWALAIGQASDILQTPDGQFI
jgi:hypothetical protein